MKKNLVTGAAGYIGSMLCTELVMMNYNVIAVDTLKYVQNSLSHLHYFKNFKLVKGDVTNKNILKEVLKGCDYIIPLAALVGAPLCKKFKKKAVELNVNSIKLLLSLVNKKQKIIYPTTNSGYGVGEKGKFCDENSPLHQYRCMVLLGFKLKNWYHLIKIQFVLGLPFGYSFR